MSYERPGQSSGESIQRATGQKTMAERLLSLLSPKAVFVTIGGGILVSAALVLTLVAGSNGNGPVVKALQSYAGFNSTTSWWQPLDSRCPAGYRIDAVGRCVPMPKPPQPVTQLKLNISATPTTVVQGGSYTLSASYIDTNGVAQKYTGLLDFQLRLCDLNNQNCQSSSGPWGDYTLSGGSVFVQLPPTIGVGIYNAAFKPRAQDGWTWSNEVAITVNSSTVQPPVANSCDTLGISGVTASSDTSLSSNPPSFAVDSRLDTFWNSGRSAPASITMDLGSNYALSKLCLKVAMTPDGQVLHIIKVGSSPTTATQAAVVNQVTHNGDWLSVSLNATGRYIVIESQQSPSWIAWTELRAYGIQAVDNNPPPPPTGCLTGSVRLTSSNIVVGGTTSVSSTLSGIAITYDTADHSIATVSGTSVTAGNTAGSTSVTGHFVYAGRSCDLTPATLTVTGGNAQGSVTTSGNSVYLCTSNGTSNSVTVTVAVSRGSGRVDVNGAVNFQGPSRLDTPNSWTQTISPGNFIGLNAASGGQASVTISLKDYFTGASIDSKTITATINPPSNCPQPGQSSLTVGTVYAACSSSLSATADSISATSATASTSRVVGNSRSLLSLYPNGSASQANVSIGYATDGNVISFSLIEDGSNRVLAGPVTKTVQANPACSPTGTITPNTSYVSTCALNGRPSSVTLSAAITTPFGEGDIVVGSGSYPGGPFGHVVAGGGAKTFNVSANQMDTYSGVTFNIRTSGGNLVSGAGAVVYRDDRNCGATGPSATLSVSPSVLPLCPGQSGRVTWTTSNTTYGGNVTQAGYGIIGQFNAPGGSGQSADILSTAIGQSVQFGGYQNTTAGPGPAFSPVYVQVTQSSNCAAPTYDLNLTANDTTVCPSANDTASMNFSGTVLNMPAGYQAANGDEITVAKDGQILIARGFVANGSGGFVAGGNYAATVAGTYSVAMNFNGQLRQVRQVFITQNCGQASGSITTSTPSPASICPGSGVFSTVGVGASVTNGGSNGSGSVTISGPSSFGPYNLQPTPGGAAGSYSTVIGGGGNLNIYTPGSYTITLVFNGQTLDTKSFTVGSYCAPTGNIGFGNPNPASICPGPGVYTSVLALGSVVNGGSGGSGTVNITGLAPINLTPIGSGIYSIGNGLVLQITQPGTYTGTLTFNGQNMGTASFTVGNNCAAPTYDLNLTANDTTVCPSANDTASMNFSGTVLNMPAGYQAANGDEITVAKDGQILIARGFVANGSGGFVAGGNYAATVAGTYSVAMNFNGQLRQVRQVFITQNCPAPTGSLSVSGGIVPCNSNNGLVNISVSGQAGVQYSVARSGGWYYNITGPGSTTDIVPLGTTYTYSLSAGSQYLGSQSVAGVQNGCAPSAAGRISAESPIALSRLSFFPYSCSAKQGSISATNTGSVDLTFSAGGVQYNVSPGQTRNTSNWYASAGTYRYDLSGPNGVVDSTTVTVTCQ